MGRYQAVQVAHKKRKRLGSFFYTQDISDKAILVLKVREQRRRGSKVTGVPIYFAGYAEVVYVAIEVKITSSRRIKSYKNLIGGRRAANRIHAK
jgi:hypothetical protein